MKYSFFEGYLISYAIYDKNEKKFRWIYNYDQIWAIIFTYILYILGYNINQTLDLVNFINIDLNTIQNHNLIICSVIYEKEQYYIILDNKTYLNIRAIDDFKETQKKFIYVVLDDKYDLTNEFEKFKNFILFNKHLETIDIINLMLSFFSKHNDTNIDDLKLKIMIDDSFNEKIYKGKDLLIINST